MEFVRLKNVNTHGMMKGLGDAVDFHNGQRTDHGLDDRRYRGTQELHVE